MIDSSRLEGAYLDHAATTPVDPEVVEAMLPYLQGHYANPSGIYRSAREVRRSLDEAHESVAQALGARPEELVFTGSGTEADNFAVIGVANARTTDGPTRLLVSAIEHHAVLRPAEELGAELLAVTPEGVLDLVALQAVLDERVALVSVMAVNNEVGTEQPIATIRELVRAHSPEALLHTDAIQALPWYDLAELTAGCDLVSVSAHKVGGPKGVGALVVREQARTRCTPVMLGGQQERGWRAGTENVAGIIGFAAALARTVERRAATIVRVAALRDRLIARIDAHPGGAIELTTRAHRHPGIAHLHIPGIDQEELLLALDARGVAASAGSACASGALDPSHVLLAMGRSLAVARSSIRLSLGTTTTVDEVEYAATALLSAVDQLRA